MSSFLGSTFADILSCYHKINWPKIYLSKFRPIYYKRFLVDIFVLFEKPEYLQQFLLYMNKEHPNIKFSKETKTYLFLSFFNIKAQGKIVNLSLVFLVKNFLIEGVHEFYQFHPVWILV